MSHILEALQRSESERAGTELTAVPTVSELLRRTEREVAARRESAIPEDKTVSKDSLFHHLLFNQTSAGTGLEVATAAAEAIGAGETAEVFSHFRKLPILESAQSQLITLSSKECPATEAFRLLAVRLQHLRHERPLRKLLITGSTAQEGKSLVASNLACTLASGIEQRVLLLDGDLRRPSLSELFGAGEVPGICEWLEGGRSPAESIYRLDDPGIWILPAGSRTENSLDPMQSKRLPALVEQLASWFDWIVIDSPPVLPFADTSFWAKLADGILLVARPGITRKKQLQRGLDALDPHKLIGAVLNSTKSFDDDSYYGYKRLPRPVASLK